MNKRLANWMLLGTMGLAMLALPALAQEDLSPPETPTTAPAGEEGATPAISPATQQNDNVEPPAAPAPKKNDSPFGNWQFLLLIGGMFLLMFWLGRKPKKEQQRRKEMLDNMKKGDKVTTIGGIIGTVLEIREDEVVVKIDEATNTKMRFVKSAISRVGDLKEIKKEENADKK